MQHQIKDHNILSSTFIYYYFYLLLSYSLARMQELALAAV